VGLNEELAHQLPKLMVWGIYVEKNKKWSREREGGELFDYVISRLRESERVSWRNIWWLAMGKADSL
jgi:hypothetical protein